MNNKGRKFLSDLKFYTDYSKWNENIERYETWEESCKSVMDTHRLFYSDKLDVLASYIDEAEESYANKLFLASQRNLQFRGEQIVSKNERMYNCSTCYMDKAENFHKAFYLTLCGCGVGVSFLNKWTSKLPKIKRRTGETKTYVIPDSIEGWANSAGILISSYCADGDVPFEEFRNCNVRFDYSQIRPKGSFISGGFKAPGPEGLKQSLERIETLFEREVSGLNIDESIKFKSIVAYDVLMHLADATLSGGVRRAAMSVIVDPKDTELINAKTGNWRTTNKQRERSNNSIGLIRNSFEYDYFQNLVNINQGTSDIGFCFLNNEYEVFNPCFTLDTKILTEDGWRTFGELLDKNPNILQDNRVQGILRDGKEEWLLDYSQSGCSINKATKVAKTGESKEVYRLETVGGRVVKATKDHDFATTKGMKKLGDLVAGDEILVAVPEKNKTNKDSLSFKEGLISGLIFGDGNISNDAANIDIWISEKNKGDYSILKYIENIVSVMITEEPKYHNKFNCSFTKTLMENYEKFRLSSAPLKRVLTNKYMFSKDNLSWIHHTSKDFKAGFISGLFFADGHVDWNANKNSISLRVTNNNKENLQNIQLILQELGVFSKIFGLLEEKMSKLPDGNGGYKEFLTKKSFRLAVSGRENCETFKDVCFNGYSSKEGKYFSILKEYPTKRNYKLKFIDKVKTIEFDSIQDVYCLEENSRRTLIAEGLSARRCFEIGMTPIYDVEKEITGIEFCNLVSINAKACRTGNRFDRNKFRKACRVAGITATLQAGYTNFPYLGKITEEIVRKESLIGVSITGWMNSPELFNEEILSEGLQIIKEINEEVAKIIGINPAARISTSKPDGNSAAILGSASGAHPEHSKRYFRIMQLNKTSETGVWLKENMPEILEESEWSATNSDYVVYTPIETNDSTIYKSEMLGIDHLEKIKFIQRNWIDKGTFKERNILPDTRNSVSCTVIVDDYESVAKYVYENQNEFVAVSFLSNYGDKDYVQAPFTSVLNAKELLDVYGDGVIFASGLIVDGLEYFDNNLWQACEIVKTKDAVIEGTRTQVLLKKDWIRRAKQFAKNYFKGDLEKTIYCLKDVHLYHKWCKITKNFKEVDFQSILLKPTFNNVSNYAAAACSGGACEII